MLEESLPGTDKRELIVKENDVETDQKQDRVLGSYRPELDGLRAIAILAVIFYHAEFTFCTGGFVGVDVFFVLSGYLMTSIISRESQNNEFSVMKFYERRIRRILPMLYSTIALFYYPAYKYLSDKEFLYFTKSSFLASFGLSNFLFASTTNGYFDTNTDLIPLIHTWTLGVEEQFYAVIPLVFACSWRFGRSTLIVVIASLALISFTLTFIVVNPVYKFYMLYTRFWELAMGSLIVFLPKQEHSDVASYIGVAFIFTSIFTFNTEMPDPSYFTLLPTIGTLLVIVFTSDKTIVGRVLSLKPFVWIGLVSYSAYLIHQPVFAFARSFTLTRLPVSNYIFLILIIFGVSFWTWRFIENPFRDRSRVSFQTVVHVVVCYLIILRLDTILFLANKSIIFDEPLNFSDRVEAIVQSQASTVSPDYVFKKLPNSALFSYNEQGPIGRTCFWNHITGTPQTQAQLCRIGRDQLNPPVYFLFGDSHSMVMANAFHDLDPPGMFAGFSGRYCHVALRPNLNSSPSRTHSAGLDSLLNFSI
jgi:peptidoglycan/LPS O-acetylase OafA/YrhL